MLVESRSPIGPPKGRPWVDAVNDDLSSLLWSTDNVYSDSDLTHSCVVTTAALAVSLEQVPAIKLAKLLRSSAFAPIVVRSPPSLRLGMRTKETGVQGWRSPLT